MKNNVVPSHTAEPSAELPVDISHITGAKTLLCFLTTADQEEFAHLEQDDLNVIYLHLLQTVFAKQNEANLLVFIQQLGDAEDVAARAEFIASGRALRAAPVASSSDAQNDASSSSTPAIDPAVEQNKTRYAQQAERALQRLLALRATQLQQDAAKTRYIPWPTLFVCITGGLIGCGAMVAVGWSLLWLLPFLGAGAFAAGAMTLISRYLDKRLQALPETERAAVERRYNVIKLFNMLGTVGLGLSLTGLILSLPVLLPLLPLVAPIALGFFGGAFIEYVVYEERIRKGFLLFIKPSKKDAARHLWLRHVQAVERGEVPTLLSEAEFIQQNQPAINQLGTQLKIAKGFALLISVGFAVLGFVEGIEALVGIANAVLAALGSSTVLLTAAVPLAIMIPMALIVAVSISGYLCFRYAHVNTLVKEGLFSGIRQNIQQLFQRQFQRPLAQVSSRELFSSPLLWALIVLLAVGAFAAFALSMAYFGAGVACLALLGVPTGALAYTISALLMLPSALMFSLYAIERSMRTVDKLQDLLHKAGHYFAALSLRAFTPENSIKEKMLELVWLFTVWVLTLHCFAEAAVAALGGESEMLGGSVVFSRCAAFAGGVSEFLLDFSFMFDAHGHSHGMPVGQWLGAIRSTVATASRSLWAWCKRKLGHSHAYQAHADASDRDVSQTSVQPASVAKPCAHNHGHSHAQGHDHSHNHASTSAPSVPATKSCASGHSHAQGHDHSHNHAATQVQATPITKNCVNGHGHDHADHDHGHHHGHDVGTVAAWRLSDATRTRALQMGFWQRPVANTAAGGLQGTGNSPLVLVK